jgi:hypothetical protein
MLRSRTAYVFGQSRVLLRAAGEQIPFRATASCVMLTGDVTHQSSSLPVTLLKVSKDTSIAELPTEGIKNCASKKKSNVVKM